MFSIRLDKTKNKIDSLSLYFGEECLSTFDEAISSLDTTDEIAKKLKKLHPLMFVHIENKLFGFSSITLGTYHTTLSLEVSILSMDISIHHRDLEEEITEIINFLDTLNGAVEAYECITTHTKEQIQKNICISEKRIEFLKSYII